MTTDRHSLSNAGPGLQLALRPREAAKALGISERTLWTWTQAGDVPHIRRGRAVLYPTRALEEWLANASQKREGGDSTCAL